MKKALLNLIICFIVCFSIYLNLSSLKRGLQSLKLFCSFHGSFSCAPEAKGVFAQACTCSKNVVFYLLTDYFSFFFAVQIFEQSFDTHFKFPVVQWHTKELWAIRICSVASTYHLVEVQNSLGF